MFSECFGEEGGGAGSKHQGDRKASPCILHVPSASGFTLFSVALARPCCTWLLIQKLQFPSEQPKRTCLPLFHPPPHPWFICSHQYPALQSLTQLMTGGGEFPCGRITQPGSLPTLLLMPEMHPSESDPCPGKKILLLNSLLGVFVSTAFFLLHFQEHGLIGGQMVACRTSPICLAP